jgi:competence protein ComEA
VVIGLRFHHPRALEITYAPAPTPAGEICINGAVNSPGLYPLFTGDSLADVIGAAGGLTDNADLSQVELKILEQGEVASFQRVNINTADAWLLEALPGLGKVKAQAVVDYRFAHGPFRDVNELLKVDGFGPVILENLRPFITVGD